MKPAKTVSQRFFTTSGQSLIEIIATIAIGTVLILALVALAVRANSSSDFSKAESQASRLSSQGLEIIRNIKASSTDLTTSNSNRVVMLNNSGCNAAGGNFTNFDGLYGGSNTLFSNFGDPAPTLIWSGDLDETGPGCYPLGIPAHLHLPGSDLVCPASFVSYCLHLNDWGASGGELITVDSRTFSRQIFIADTPIALGGKSSCNTTAGDYTQIKQFSVVVSWTDPSGTHQVTNTTCLRRN